MGRATPGIFVLRGEQNPIEVRKLLNKQKKKNQLGETSSLHYTRK